MNISDEIKRLHELHQAGALTDAEFERAKAKLLDGAVDLNKSPAGGYDSAGSGASGSGASSFNNEFSQLRRARADRWLGGVCGGLAKVSGLESWVWRLVFALFTISFGFGAVIYLLMWIFVPEE
jgi:phage shock protein PspC (stress-responsive transcriptional regulator)